MNRLISASGPWGSGSFVYDALGNLRSKTLGNRTVSLSYNSVNQLSQSNDSGHSGLRNFSYDSRGNVISAGNLQFNYDETDQPISISGSANGTYSYDAQLKRVKQQVNGNTIYSVYNQAGQLVHIDNLGTQQQTDYLSGPQGSFARISNGVISYLHPDILGSAQSATDANGNLLWQQQYTPFGEELQPVSANHHQAGFTGHISDTDTGLHYMQARYYDPVVGRFYSNDPVGFSVNNPMMFNRYAYANNNPFKYVDPDGRDAYLVSRPLGFTSTANHNFIVYNATSLGDPNATVRSFGDVGDDTMGEVTLSTEGFSEGTLQADITSWQSLSSEGSTATFRKIDAEDTDVARIADSVKGGQEYSLIPEIQGGVNSNSAAGAIANRSDGGSSKVENGLKQPGASMYHQVEFKEEKQ